jgi:two-component system, LytTR family, response regulator
MVASYLKTIVVDDEQPSRDALLQCIHDFCPEIKVVAECNSAKTAFQAIEKHHPDLVFLDIEMPKGSGFDLLKMFNPVDFKVIFVTAYSQYAVQAFRYSAVDYLLKPVKLEELIEAVAKVIRDTTPVTRQISLLLENVHTTDENCKKMAIVNSKGFDIVKTADIVLCKADGYCTSFYLAGKIKISSTHILKHYEEVLPKEQFMRVHHSYIINKDHVKGYTNQGEVVLTDELHCPLSLSRKVEFMRTFKLIK